MKRAAFVLGTLLLLALAASDVSAVDQARLLTHASGIWKIRSAGTLRRWIVIHNVEEARSTGIFHIEVLGRLVGRPPWEVKHLCNHMAITAEALAKSVIAPLKSGAVYPESYDVAYAQWQAQAAQGKPEVCERSVRECLPGSSALQTNAQPAAR